MWQRPGAEMWSKLAALLFALSSHLCNRRVPPSRYTGYMLTVCWSRRASHVLFSRGQQAQPRQFSFGGIVTPACNPTGNPSCVSHVALLVLFRASFATSSNYLCPRFTFSSTKSRTSGVRSSRLQVGPSGLGVHQYSSANILIR